MGVEQDTEPKGYQRHRTSESGVNLRASDLEASGQGFMCPLLKSVASEVPELEGTEGSSRPGRLTISLSRWALRTFKTALQTASITPFPACLEMKVQQEDQASDLKISTGTFPWMLPFETI